MTVFYFTTRPASGPPYTTPVDVTQWRFEFPLLKHLPYADELRQIGVVSACSKPVKGIDMCRC
jgi:hypothetical protein